MSSYNHVAIMGNLTRNPELRYTPSGTPVANFGLASNRKYKQGDEEKEDVCFVEIVVFGKTGESVSGYLEKGKRVLVEGRLQFRQWKTDDGAKRSKHEVVAEKVVFL